MMGETYREAFLQDQGSSYISHGLPYPEACAKHVAETFHASRIYVLASGSLSRKTDAVDRLNAALNKIVGNGAVVGVMRGIRPHTYYSDVLCITKEAKEFRADCLVTIGAGSLTDAAKVATLALANDINTLQELETLRSDSPILRGHLLPATLPIICIPTSLSAGEYTALGGATNDETHHKHPFEHPSIRPRLVILDPDLSRTTPERVWLSTGIRAVDHCVEAICSIKATPEGDQMAESGLRKLLPGLLETKVNPDILGPRLLCQLGAIEAIVAVLMKIPMGASHGIGHQLGPLGVGHGETSCVLLPAICKWNERVNGAQQQKVLNIIWSEASVRRALEAWNLTQGTAGLGEALDAIFRELGMPRSLKDVGVAREKLERLAWGSLEDRWCKTNPIPLEKKEQVLEILDMIVGV